MAAGSLRREVLQSFKKMHQMRCHVFQGDDYALSRVRQEINENYKKNKNETDVEKIKELIKFANEVIHEVRTNVVQMEQVKPGTFRLLLRPEMFEDQSGIEKNKQHVEK